MRFGALYYGSHSQPWHAHRGLAFACVGELSQAFTGG
jgi:hypothetical protein